MDAETPEKWFSAEVATFGDRLAAARENAGMSQKTLATRLGVRLTTVQAWESDTTEPRANRMQMLAGMLNVSLMWLLAGRGDGLDGPPGSGTQTARANAAALQSLHEIRSSVADLDGRLARLEETLTAAGGKSDDRNA
ncbi:MAG: helix-turn-helix transcriptional regulator [Phaeovulum sp.]|uniref:helix-turn-helix domain-containing protein n=1 Tax=Phaeovulum sp. TaxID=2934796 RepID=UPI002730968F|nr:helix-turn-helix transcriptional regulator [Phaeovulum sp.]MDP2063331.1 helix-turn-helix transcriptional regulator [Phaeovulum sp.]MDP3861194.1 helix-turn-helix transcriptional regulator [Phaeovulum sp.]